MKRWSVRSGFVLALALAGMLVLGTSAAFAKSYEMTRVWIDAQVAPDGSMTVTEERTFDFDGDYTFAYWELDKGGSAGIEVLGVSGPEGEYARSEYNDIDPNRTPQTFTVVDYELFSLLAAHAATAIFSSKLYSQSERKLNTIQSFLDLLTTN